MSKYHRGFQARLEMAALAKSGHAFVLAFDARDVVDLNCDGA